MTLPDWASGYGATAGAALVGSIARGRSWLGADGRFRMTRLLPEVATAVGLSFGIMAVGEWGHVDLKVLAGMAVFAGWLGPAAVADMALARFGTQGTSSSAPVEKP